MFKKILVLSPGYIPVPSGAEISIHQTLKYLCSNSLECSVLTISDNPTLTNFFKVEDVEIIDKVKIHRIKRIDFLNELAKVIGDFDLIILQMNKRFESLGIKDIEYFLDSHKVKWIYMQRDDPVRDLSKAKYVIVNSKYSQAEYIKLTKITKKNTFVLTPPMSDLEYTENKGDNYITIINPILRKGGDAFRYLADQFPNEKFLAQLGWGVPVAGLDNLKNVEVIDPVKDMKELYRKTSILLVPSIYEAYGRVSMEGALSGCIVISSNIGGLKEINLPPECFVKDIDLKLWKKKLSQILSLSNDEKSILRKRIYNRVKNYRSDLNGVIPFIEKIIRH